MKKITLSALAAFAVAGTAIAGPTVVTSKEFKQPCTTPCFRDQEFQLDLFYSYNDASHQGSRTGRDSFTGDTLTTPVDSGAVNPLLRSTTYVPAGSEVVPQRSVKASVPQYFNDGSGGGLGLNYFFARYFGIGVDGNWWNGIGGDFSGNVSSRDYVTLAPGFTTVQGVTGSIDLPALLAAAHVANTSVTVIDPNTLILKRNRELGNRNSNRSVANQVSGSLILRYPFEGPICWAPYIFGGGGGVFDGDSVGFGHVGLGVEFRVTPYMGFFTDWRWEFMGGSNNNNEINDSSRNRYVVFDPVTGTSSVHKFRNVDNNNNSRNDVNMTRVGVRFVF